MQTRRRKPGIMALVIILVVSNLLGIKAAGKLLIPTAGGEKSYRGVITITRAEIKIECDKKIFQLLNEFNSPKTGEINVNTAEVEKVCLQEKTIFILPETNFHQRYRHLFHPCERLINVMYFIVEKKNAMIFIIDNPDDIDFLGKKVIKLINKRNQATNATFE